ncbi:MAG: cation diffusion facilitator family transporter [candidate division NC10 bacterium]|nr:cation diffusion facilitator family transporter [candidate division NC10 bacterium]
MSSAHAVRGQHAHSFGQGRKRPGESRTLVVVAVTAVTMGVEIVAGVWFGSMALLADGLHMTSHAVALRLNVAAYIYARRHADDPRYSFGTGKVNALGGFTGAILLLGFALLMAWESTARLLHPIPIAVNQALLVAIVGLLVNGLSVVLLDAHAADPPPGQALPATAHGAMRETAPVPDHHHDHNLRSAYLHVLADALTSVLAIVALLGAKYGGLTWMDPAMGILGAALVTRWSWGLVRASTAVLLDRQGPADLRTRLVAAMEADGVTRVADLHLWAIGPGIYSAIVGVVTPVPHSPAAYKARVPRELPVVHLTVEVEIGDGQARDAPEVS